MSTTTVGNFEFDKAEVDKFYDGLRDAGGDADTCRELLHRMMKRLGEQGFIRIRMDDSVETWVLERWLRRVEGEYFSVHADHGREWVVALHDPKYYAKW